MPLYEYQCRKCDHRFEKIEKVAGPHAKSCPKCRGQLERVATAPAIRFKGSGWYVTDYPRKGAPGSESSEGDSAKSEKPKKETKEAAPAKETKKASAEKKEK